MTYPLQGRCLFSQMSLYTHFWSCRSMQPSRHSQHSSMKGLGPSLMHFFIHSGICHALCVLSLVPAVPSTPTLFAVYLKVYPGPHLASTAGPKIPPLTTLFCIFLPSQPPPDPGFLHRHGPLLSLNSVLINDHPKTCHLLRVYTRIMAGPGPRDLQAYAWILFKFVREGHARDVG